MKNKGSKKYESTVQEVNIFIPPDGGYAWIILIAAFMSNFAVDGIVFSFSLAIIPDFSDKLGLPASKVAIISSIQVGLYYLIGPISSAFINRHGFRAVGIGGTLIAFAGIFIASHMDSFAVIITLYGAMAGVGFGMVYTASNICVGYYFEKYRALATGLAACGSSFGGLCLSPLFAQVSADKGWDFTMKIQSFLLFVCLFAALAFRPLKSTTRVPLTQDIISEIDVKTPSRVEFVELYKTDSMVSIDLDDHSDESRNFPQISIISSRFLPIAENTERERKCCSCAWIRDLCYSKPAFRTNKLNVISTGPMDRKDILYTGSVVHLPEYKMTMRSENSQLNSRRTMISYHLSMVLDTDKIISNETTPVLEFHEDIGTCLGISHMIHKVLGNLFDMSLLKSVVFCLLALASLCYALAWMTPYMFLQQRGQINHIPDSYTNWFISWISIGNATGRISAGVIATVFSKMNVCYMSASTTIFAGIITISSAYAGTDDIAVQISYCVLFGFSVAFQTTLRNVVFVKLLGLKKLTNAYGLSAVAIGIGLLSGTPLASALFKKTESFWLTFVLSGVMFIASGVLTILAFHIDKWQKRKK